MFQYSCLVTVFARLCIFAAATSIQQAGPEVKGRDTAASHQKTAAVSAASHVATVLWSADLETGDLSQWYDPGASARSRGGGSFNSGIAETVPSQDFAHSGKWSLKATITTPYVPTSGARMFRWRESQDERYYASGLYYSAWFLFPKLYTLTANPHRGRFWNIFQFKSKTSSRIDPVWFLDVANRASTGAMYLTLHWWDGLAIEGPHTGESGGRRYQQDVKDIPVGHWTHIEAYLKQSADFAGEITVWQDEVLLFDQKNVRTKYPSGDNQWSVNNYSDGLIPTPATIYIDDASIAAERTGR